MTSLQTPTSVTVHQLEAEWADWHADREAALTAPHGWLTPVGFHYVSEDPAAIDGIPGTTFRLSADGVAAEIEDGSDVVDLRAGSVAQSRLSSRLSADVSEGGSLFWLRHGDVVAELVRRSGRLAIRVRDAQAVTRTSFAGVPAYPVRSSWRVPAEFVSYPAPVPVTVGAARPDLHHSLLALGRVAFFLDSRREELVVTGVPAVPGRDEVTGQLVFHDRTNGSGTAPWSTLTVVLPVAGGPVVLDFNRTVNLPFAFTAFGTCPRPVAENVLEAPVTAGEKAPRSAAAAGTI